MSNIYVMLPIVAITDNVGISDAKEYLENKKTIVQHTFPVPFHYMDLLVEFGDYYWVTPLTASEIKAKIEEAEADAEAKMKGFNRPEWLAKNEELEQQVQSLQSRIDEAVAVFGKYLHPNNSFPMSSTANRHDATLPPIWVVIKALNKLKESEK